MRYLILLIVLASCIDPIKDEVGKHWFSINTESEQELISVRMKEIHLRTGVMASPGVPVVLVGNWLATGNAAIIGAVQDVLPDCKIVGADTELIDRKNFVIDIGIKASEEIERVVMVWTTQEATGSYSVWFKPAMMGDYPAMSGCEDSREKSF